jgi:hypothetical protein
MKTSDMYKLYHYPKGDDPAVRKQIEDLRRRGHRGGYILDHRSLLTSRRGWAKVLMSAALTAALFAVWLLAMDHVSGLWAKILSFWNDALGMGGYVTLIHYQLAGIYEFPVPYLHVTSDAPDYVSLIVGWVATVLLFIASFFLPRRHVPVIYGIRVVLMFQLCAQVFFTFVPLSFPYSASGYVHGVLIAGLALISLVPILLGFTYFIFDFSFWRKLGLALLIMLYLIVLIPVQFGAHAFLLHHSTILYLPVLFFAFGLPLDVMIFIALYSWGASWKNNLYREDIPPEVGHGEV